MLEEFRRYSMGDDCCNFVLIVKMLGEKLVNNLVLNDMVSYVCVKCYRWEDR